MFISQKFGGAKSVVLGEGGLNSLLGGLTPLQPPLVFAPGQYT